MSFKKGMMYVFVANILNLLISLFTGFVLPKFLSIDTYANIKLFQLYITYIGILHLGFADGMYLRIGGKDLENIDKKEMAEEFKTFKIFQLFVTIMAVIVSILIKNEILFFCAIVILPINVGSYLRLVYQAIGQFKRYSRFMNINTLMIFFVNIFLLFIIRTDSAPLYIIGYIIVYFAYWLLIELETRKIFGKYKVSQVKKYLVKDIKDGFVLMIGNFCNVIFTGIDRIFVQNIFGSIKFAFYSFAVSIENLMNVFVTPISTVMYNYLCNNSDKDQIKRIKKLILVFSAVIVAVVFPAKFIVQIAIQKYNESLSVLFLLFAAQCITIMVRCIHVNLYKAKKQQNRYFIKMVVIIIVSIISNILLYAIFRSMEAIAVATLITSVIWFIIGEIDFKEYMLKLNNYIYIFVQIAVFLVCGQMISNAILGCLVYVVMTIIITIIFMSDTLIYALSEVKPYINKIFKRR